MRNYLNKNAPHITMHTINCIVFLAMCGIFALYGTEVCNAQMLHVPQVVDLGSYPMDSLDYITNVDPVPGFWDGMAPMINVGQTRIYVHDITTVGSTGNGQFECGPDPTTRQ